MHAYIEHNGKHYSVTFGSGYYGFTRISHTFDVSTQGFKARASYAQRTVTVDPNGRLGMQILRKAAAQLITTK